MGFGAGRTAVVALGLAGVLTLAAGCRVFDESLLLAPPDAGTDAPESGTPDVDAGPGCELARPPERPAGADDAGDAGEHLFVLHEFVFDQRDERWRTIGFDLDGLCSYGDPPAVECLPPAMSAPPETDGEGGRDNALGHQILSLLLFAFPDLEQRLDGQRVGHGSVLLRLTGWNGRDDDPRVHVAFSQTVIGTPPLPDGGIPVLDEEAILDGDFPAPPRWDGQDWFWLRTSNFLDGDLARPRVYDDNAYVSGRVLVLRIPDRFAFTFRNRSQAFVVFLTDGVVAARISDDASGFDWVQMGGRWPVTDLLAYLPHGGICVGSEYYRMIERVTDLAADVRAQPGTGEVGGTVTCDAISGGLTMIGTRGRFAGFMSIHDEIPNACAELDAGVPDGGAGEDAGSPDDGGVPDDAS